MSMRGVYVLQRLRERFAVVRHPKRRMAPYQHFENETLRPLPTGIDPAPPLEHLGQGLETAAIGLVPFGAPLGCGLADW